MSTPTRKREIAQLREAGRLAFLQGRSVHSNPYRHMSAVRWYEGFEEAQAQAERAPAADPLVALTAQELDDVIRALRRDARGTRDEAANIRYAGDSDDPLYHTAARLDALADRLEAGRTTNSGGV